MITSPIWACLCLIILRIGAKPSFEGPVEISELFGSPEDRVEEVFDDEPEEPDQVLDRTVVRVDENFQNCSDFAVDGYRCVSYDQCVDGEILTSGAGLIDVRNGFLEPEVSHCPSYLEVCCRLATHFGQPIRPRPKPPTRAQFVSSCGKRNQDGVQVRIQSDSLSGATQFGEWPHMCVVLRKVLVVGEEISTYLCGGSLIHQNVILTAAHCVQKYDSSEIRVRCGEWDTQQTIEPSPHADRDVRYSSIHPGFNNASLHNDFALLHLEEPFELAPHIDVMCLPTEERLGYNKADCIATGWGKDQFGVKGKYQVIPKQISLDLVSNADCEQTLRNTRLGEFFILDKSFMCAGGQEGEDTCKGDGGGPLICPMDDGSYVQTGIVAWGIDCGKNGIPGVYADVQDGLCFIDYALRCQEGKDVAEQIGIKGCKGWMGDQLKLLREQKFKYQKLVTATEGRSKASHNRKFQDTNQLIKKFARFRRECKLNRQEEFETDVEEVIDPVDVSGFVRIGGGGFEPEPEIQVNSENEQVAESESETETSTETTTLSPFAEIVEEIDQ